MSEIKHQDLDLSNATMTIEMPTGRVATLVCGEGGTLSLSTMIEEPEHRHISALDGQPCDESELGKGRCGIFETVPDQMIGLKVAIDAPMVHEMQIDATRER